MVEQNIALADWLKPFVEKLGHKKRRQMCPVYVSGLIGPGDRKSIEPMAERLAPDHYDRLHHFISDGIWDASPLETELAVQADRIVGASDAFLVVDDTGLPKKGDHSVGVAPQYASMLGKRANCQTLVSLTLARDEVPVPVGLRLFLPESWTSNQDRMVKAGVPEEMRISRTKLTIALDEIDRLIAAGVRFGTVLADAGYGLSAAFRQGLSARGLTWAVGIPKHQKVYPHDVALIFPVSGHGRPRKHSIPDTLSMAAETILEASSWKKVSWRRGTKGRLTARFAALRIRIADGSPQRILDKGQQHMPGEEAWLVGEWRSNGERKYYLSNLPAEATLKQLAAAIKARWVCEQAHQQMKEELGLDHFEGRSWQGLHRHALMTMIAYAFLQHQRLHQAKREKNQEARPA
ncbi:IS701 family transposase [Agrobacterium sp. ST15.13.013]|uniref:IS701 family transposase n=3 Tax=Agrobacterium salinitolerans TaxID=1183413 RepID=A0A9X9KEL1_9HYPH|nr:MULTISPECIES: IS701 family transposase [Rhizobium/Agrobacterium group]KRA61122.1 transposase [Rhizobium sp. Root651]MDA5641574.1 IS701 family transposase [Agrobacterium sp. ST15.13.013]QXC52871.1 IS701 family transposase [Agrobacterium salinitolerans]UYZ09030.1 IS701 family transposase [Agrobacterium salinitolerans]UYZ09048.1 IS701 family transposase [Agrobacterium salinitolerans]